MTHHTDAELLPCPFCGAAPKIEGLGAVRWIKCPDDSACGSGGMAIGIPADDLARGIASWNRRAPAAPVPKGWKLVPVELLERIQESLGSFVSDQGWSQSDMDTADALDGLLAAAPQSPGVEVANKCAQCKKAYSASKNSVGCPKCAPGKAIDEAEFIKPITSTPVRKSASAPTPNNPQEIAPVQLPEFAGIVVTLIGNYASVNAAPFVRKGDKLYTEPQVRDLLAKHGIKVET